MDFMRQWAKDIRDAVRGKIWWNGGVGWTLGDSGYTNPQGVTLRPRVDQDGKAMSLAKGRFVSNCPSPPVESPRLSSGYSVRMGACNKCPNRLPQMCCSVLKERGKDAPKQALTDIANAVKTANEIVGGTRPGRSRSEAEQPTKDGGE